MRVLVKPVKDQESPLVERYCDIGGKMSLIYTTIGKCEIGVFEDQINSDDEILF